MVVEIEGVALHYQVTGEGEPLLWLHGFMGAGADWQHLFPEPPVGFQIIAPDLRGHGATFDAQAPPVERFSFRQAGLDVLALLRHLGITRVKAIGLSGGGLALLHAATMAPQAVAAMVLVSAPPYFPAPARALQRSLSSAMFGAAEMAAMQLRHAHGQPQIDRLFAQGQAMADDYDDVSFTPAKLSTVTAETLIVFGDRDPLYPVSLAMDLHAGIPRSYLWVVPNGGHGPIFGDAAPQFTTTALAFLRGEWR